MRKILKWVGLLIGGLVLLLVLAVATVYLIVGQELSKTHEIAGTDVAVPTAAVDVAEGERLARILGCNGGCHGRTGPTGGIFFELPDGSKLVTPDLHRLAAEYSTAELEGVIRHGVKPDGRTVFGVMPSKLFYHLTDRQLGQVISFLRSRPAGDENLPATWYGPMLRTMMFIFERAEGFEPYAVQAIDHSAPQLAYDPSNPIQWGHYLAITSCAECHGYDLTGAPDGTAPNLTIVAAYSAEAFSHLLRTGVPMGGRELDLMAQVAQERFAHFTEPEVRALYAYLRDRAGVAAAGN